MKSNLLLKLLIALAFNGHMKIHAMPAQQNVYTPLLALDIPQQRAKKPNNKNRLEKVIQEIEKTTRLPKDLSKIISVYTQNDDAPSAQSASAWAAANEACRNSLGSTCFKRTVCPIVLCMIGLTVFLSKLVIHPTCGIPPSENVEGICWQSMIQNCCDLPTQIINGDSIPGVTQASDLKFAVAKKAFGAGCFDIAPCIQQIDCAQIDPLSSSFYKNFDPCNKKQVKPSRLKRKMAREKQRSTLQKK